MSSITPLAFTGVSQFSEDFQTILTRAVSIASLPVKALQAEQVTLLSKKQTLGSLRSAVADFGSAVTALGAIGANKGVAVSSSNANRVTVTNNGATSAAVHTITDITSVAKAASETSTSGYATADTTSVEADGTLQLVLGASTYTVTLAAGKDNLNGLRDAINALGIGVTATVLNTGTGATPYYLSLNATVPGATTLQLRRTAGDAATNILTSTNQGANAVFKLNGLSITKSDNVVSDAIPGITFTIVSTTTVGESVTLTLASDRATLATALDSLATKYNTLRDQVLQQVGKNAGALGGDFIVRLIQEKLRGLTAYQGTGAIKALADLGIELSSAGKMSFNSTKYYSLSSTDFAAAFSFLGSTTTGWGALASGFTSISDPITGLIKTQQDQYDAADKRLTTQITDLNKRIEFMRSSLSRQLQQADSLLAKLGSQQSLLSASLKGLESVLYNNTRGSK